MSVTLKAFRESVRKAHARVFRLKPGPRGNHRRAARNWARRWRDPTGRLRGLGSRERQQRAHCGTGWVGQARRAIPVGVLFRAVLPVFFVVLVLFFVLRLFLVFCFAGGDIGQFLDLDDQILAGQFGV